MSRWSRIALAAVLPLLVAARPRRGPGPAVSGTRTVMPRGMRDALARASAGTVVPSFSRQTGLSCSACHYQFPQLTPFGRLFKLNGYSIVGLKRIVEPDVKKRSPLDLLPIPPLAAMVQTSFTHLGKARPGTQNDNGTFPQQFSFFFAGAVSSHLGTFLQATYNGTSGTFGIDNTEIRYTDRASIGTGDLIYGVTLHNNPTVQDVWNTTPAWGFPFATSAITPSSVAGTVIDGRLAQGVIGLGGYALMNKTLYVEVTGYRSAPQGALQVDTLAVDAIHGIAPYWRAALQHQFGTNYAMIGTYGIRTHQYPLGITGPTDAFTDVAADAQVEHPITDGGAFILRATWIHERQSLPALVAAGAAANLHNTLNTVRINASVQPNALVGASAGYFSTTGTRDTLAYAPGLLTGSGTGRPGTDGIIEELDFNPWQNTRFSIQGVEFTRFNGAAHLYDGVKRNAWNNNTLYLLAWIAF